VRALAGDRLAANTQATRSAVFGPQRENRDEPAAAGLNAIDFGMNVQEAGEAGLQACPTRRT
jgi:hypothetical protein